MQNQLEHEAGDSRGMRPSSIRVRVHACPQSALFVTFWRQTSFRCISGWQCLLLGITFVGTPFSPARGGCKQATIHRQTCHVSGGAPKVVERDHNKKGEQHFDASWTSTTSEQTQKLRSLGFSFFLALTRLLLQYARRSARLLPAAPPTRARRNNMHHLLQQSSMY